MKRSVKNLDQIPSEYAQSGQAAIKYFRNGHKGLLTLKNQENNFETTTYTGDFVQRDNYDPNGEPKGIRYKLTEETIRNRLIEEMEQQTQNDYQDEQCDYKTEFKDKYIMPGFRHEPPKPFAVKNFNCLFNQKLIFFTHNKKET